MSDKLPINDEIVIKNILSSKGPIAIVGLSPKEERDSNKVARYLMSFGYKIVPVNPMVDEILGEKSYKSLEEIPFDIETVDVFRRPDDVPPIVEASIKKGAKNIWLQLGVVNEEGAKMALDNGLGVVMDRCIKIEHGLMI